MATLPAALISPPVASASSDAAVPSAPVADDSSNSTSDDDGAKSVGMVPDSSTTSSIAPHHGNKRFFSDSCNAVQLNKTRKEWSLATAGASWMKSEKGASQAVAKATSRHTYFRNLLGERAAKVAKKGLVDTSAVVVSSPPAPTRPAAPTMDPPPVMATPTTRSGENDSTALIDIIIRRDGPATVTAKTDPRS